MINQFVEHDGDRFRDCVNAMVPASWAGLPHGDVWGINVVFRLVSFTGRLPDRRPKRRVGRFGGLSFGHQCNCPHDACRKPKLLQPQSHNCSYSLCTFCSMDFCKPTCKYATAHRVDGRDLCLACSDRHPRSTHIQSGGKDK